MPRVDRIVKRLRLKDKVKDAEKAFKMGFNYGVRGTQSRIIQAAFGLDYGPGYPVVAQVQEEPGVSA